MPKKRVIQRKKFLLGIDLGGTNLTSAIISFSGKILAKDKREARAFLGAQAVIDRVKDSAHEVLKQLDLDLSQISALGMGAPGPLNTKHGIIYETPNLPFKNFPMKKIIQREFPVPLFLENDANAAAWGEKWIGAAKNYNHVVCITLGTGIGGGIILDGQLWRGPDDTGAEIGHMTLFPEGVVCNCGNRGCLEAYASASAIARRAREAIKEGKKSILKNMVDGDLSRITSETVYGAILKGDVLARKIMEDTGKYLGIAVASLVNLLNPEMVVFGGGVIRAGESLFGPLRQEAKRRAFKVPFSRVKIVKAKLGSDAGVIGAAGVALQRFGK